MPSLLERMYIINPRKCLNCGKILKTSQKKYCCNKCKNEGRRKKAMIVKRKEIQIDGFKVELKSVKIEARQGIKAREILREKYKSPSILSQRPEGNHYKFLLYKIRR